MISKFLAISNHAFQAFRAAKYALRGYIRCPCVVVWQHAMGKFCRVRQLLSVGSASRGSDDQVHAQFGSMGAQAYLTRGSAQ